MPRGFAPRVRPASTCPAGVGSSRSACQGSLRFAAYRLRDGEPQPALRKARHSVVTAFILMNVERTRLRAVTDDLLALDGIAEVYSVAGPFDLIAVARVRQHEELNDLVTERVAELEGIVSTETLIAFRSLAKKDLGLLWDIGS